MKPVVAWLKSNALLLAWAFLALLAVGVVLTVRSFGGGLMEKMAAESKRGSEIDTLTRNVVDLPDGTQITIQAINSKSIEDMKKLYAAQGEELVKITNYARDFNSQYHAELLEGVFRSQQDPSYNRSLPYRFGPRYMEALQEMLQPASATALLPVQLDAKPPAPTSELQATLEKTEADFIGISRTAADLTEDDRVALGAAKQKAHVEYLQRYAHGTHLFADTNPQSSGFPFDIYSFKSGNNPRPEEMWEAQVSLWVQQDLARAIAQTNRTSDPTTNVMTAPIKQLLRIRVEPGLIGGEPQKLPPATPGVPGAGAPAAASAAKPVTPATNVTTKLEPKFAVSSSGRASNPLYDVRWVELTVVADAQRLPEFFYNLSQTNLMSVLSCEIKDVDELDALKNGMHFGSGDAVQVRLLIETLWLRSWMVPMMPDAVRAMGQPPATRVMSGSGPAVGAATGAPGGAPGGMMGRPGGMGGPPGRPAGEEVN